MAVLLYDGLCALCNGAVKFILKHDRVGAMRFAALNGAYADGVRARHPELAGVDSIVLVEGVGDGERVYVRSDAALRVADYLGGACRVLGVLRVVPRGVRDAVYDGVARTRYRVFGRLEACPVPPAHVAQRFIPPSNPPDRELTI